MRLSECLRAEVTPSGWLLTDTKNGERRIVPVHPRVAYLARRWPPAVPARTAQAWFLWATRYLGIDDLHFHDLRHSAASAMINSGVPLYTVGAVLGHKAAASTKRYSHLDTRSLEDAVGRIGRKRRRVG
jgi:integrase